MSAQQAAPVVTITNLSVTRGRRQVLSDITLTLKPGVTAICGQNGSGKSTLLLALASLLPHSGTVEIHLPDSPPDAGTVLSRHARRRSSHPPIGYLPQDPSFPGTFTVEEALDHVAWLWRLPAHDATQRISDLVERLDLACCRRTRISHLSGGTNRRAMLALEMLHEPPLLLLDEPTAGLDLVSASACRRAISDYAATHVVAMASHSIDDLDLIADQVAVLSNSTVIWNGSPQDLGPATASGSRTEALQQALTSLLLDHPHSS